MWWERIRNGRGNAARSGEAAVRRAHGQSSCGGRQFYVLYAKLSAIYYRSKAIALFLTIRRKALERNAKKILCPRELLVCAIIVSLRVISDWFAGLAGWSILGAPAIARWELPGLRGGGGPPVHTGFWKNYQKLDWISVRLSSSQSFAKIKERDTETETETETDKE